MPATLVVELPGFDVADIDDVVSFIPNYDFGFDQVECPHRLIKMEEIHNATVLTFMTEETDSVKYAIQKWASENCAPSPRFVDQETR